MTTATLSPLQSFYAVYNEQKPDLLDEILAESYVGHVNGHDIVGATAAKGFINGFIAAFPDSFYSLEDTIESGNKTTVRWTCTATQKGAFFGIEPTHKKVIMTGITIFEVVDGKIVQLWNNWDVFGLVNQLKA